MILPKIAAFEPTDRREENGRAAWNIPDFASIMPIKMIHLRTKRNTVKSAFKTIFK